MEEFFREKKCMSARHLFIDTNILVYAHDAGAGKKHKAARELVSTLWERPYPPAISTQVLQELYASLAKKGASAQDCRRVVEIYFDWEIIGHDLSLIKAAIDLRDQFKLGFWDSLIVSAALRARAAELWTEDLQDGQEFAELTVINPIS